MLIVIILLHSLRVGTKCFPVRVQNLHFCALLKTQRSKGVLVPSTVLVIPGIAKSRPMGLRYILVPCSDIYRSDHSKMRTWGQRKKNFK